MAKKKKRVIDFSAFEELAADFEKLGGDTKKIVEECLEIVPDMINPSLHKDMEKHRRTGTTEKSIVEKPKVEWQGNIAKIPIGFDLKNGGMPSIFLMYGSPRHAPKNQYGGKKRADAKDNPGFYADKKLYNGIYGTAIKKKINDAQEKIMREAIEKRLGG